MLLSSVNSMLAEKLNMTPEEAERWIVNLIRNARLDAKIDSKLVGLRPVNVHCTFIMEFHYCLSCPRYVYLLTFG